MQQRDPQRIFQRREKTDECCGKKQALAGFGGEKTGKTNDDKKQNQPQPEPVAYRIPEHLMQQCPAHPIMRMRMAVIKDMSVQVLMMKFTMSGIMRMIMFVLGVVMPVMLMVVIVPLVALHRIVVVMFVRVLLIIVMPMIAARRVIMLFLLPLLPIDGVAGNVVHSVLSCA